jgi:hypothetical protein
VYTIVLGAAKFSKYKSSILIIFERTALSGVTTYTRVHVEVDDAHAAVQLN